MCSATDAVGVFVVAWTISDSDEIRVVDKLAMMSSGMSVAVAGMSKRVEKGLWIGTFKIGNYYSVFVIKQSSRCDLVVVVNCDEFASC